MPLTRQDQIILQLARRGAPEGPAMPATATQDGIAVGVGISRGHTAIEVQHMIDRQLIGACSAHIRGGSRRRKAYFLLPEGFRRLKDIEERMARAGLTDREVLVCLEERECPAETAAATKAQDEALTAVSFMTDDPETGQRTDVPRAVWHLTAAINMLMQLEWQR